MTPAEVTVEALERSADNLALDALGDGELRNAAELYCRTYRDAPAGGRPPRYVVLGGTVGHRPQLLGSYGLRPRLAQATDLANNTNRCGHWAVVIDRRRRRATTGWAGRAVTWMGGPVA